MTSALFDRSGEFVEFPVDALRLGGLDACALTVTDELHLRDHAKDVRFYASVTMGLTRTGWRAYHGVPEPDVPHARIYQIDLRAQEHAGDLRGDHDPHGCLLP